MPYVIEKTTASGKPLKRYLAEPDQPTEQAEIWTNEISRADFYEHAALAEGVCDMWRDYLAMQGNYADARVLFVQGDLTNG